MKRKTLIGSAIILLIVVLAGGGAYYALAMPLDADGQTAVSDEVATQTAVARQGDLIIYASGNGELVAQDETALEFDDNGTLVELLVNVGDQAAAGDVLARLEIDRTEAQLAAEIAQAELAVVQAQQTLDSLYEEAELRAAQALFDLETAQEALADLQNNDLEVAQAQQAVAQAEAAIEDAEMMLYIHNSAPSEDAIYTAYASLLFKEKKYKELQDQLAQLKYEYKKANGQAARKRVESQIERVTAQMYNAQVVYEEALYHYETIADPADSLDINLSQTQMNTAQAQLVNANQELAAAQQGTPAGEIALAEANLKEAQAEWERWQDGPDPEEIILAETRLEAAQLESQLAQQASLIADLIAPMDGTVTEIYVAINQVVASDHILTLADISQPLIKVYLDETDYESAVVGNRVEVIFDALPDQTFTGSLLEVSPSINSESNSQGQGSASSSQAVQGLARLEDLELALPIGLNAAVDVIAGEAINAVLVPIEALHEASPGNYTVYVQTGDGFEPREVTIGLMDYTSAEITSGLEAGEIVSLGTW